MLRGRRGCAASSSQLAETAVVGPWFWGVSSASVWTNGVSRNGTPTMALSASPRGELVTYVITERTLEDDDELVHPATTDSANERARAATCGPTMRAREHPKDGGQGRPTRGAVRRIAGKDSYFAGN
jgi:hypothetical protein